jgi:hypothetical protein
VKVQDREAIVGQEERKNESKKRGGQTKEKS